MRILVLGGTYFLGRAFVEAACPEHEITLINRGAREVSFSHPEHIRQITRDRHALTPDCLGGERFDALVDFCAYEKGDILQAADAAGGRLEQYIFISTSDVYERGTGGLIDENGRLETRDYGGAAGAYILGKAALERELLEAAKRWKLHYNSVRPCFIYGPGNYAGREHLFFHWIDQAGQILFPEDADGSFQMVYVEDAANAILTLCGRQSCFDACFNLCGDEPVTYESFCDALAYAAGRDFERVNLPVEEILRRQIPLPFPLTREESNLYGTVNGGLLPVSYRPLKEGLRLTYLNGQKG